MKWWWALGLGGAGGVYLVENDEALQNALTDTLPAVREMADSAAGLASIGVPPNTMLAIVAIMFLGRPILSLIDKMLTAKLEADRAARESARRAESE